MVQAEHRVNGAPVRRVHILVGLHSNISPAALCRQFARATVGSPLAGAELVFHVVADPLSPDALAVRVIDVEVDAAA